MSPITGALNTRIRPSFVMRNGRYVRNDNSVEVPIRSSASGNSLAKFPRAVGRISHHRWA